jgi:hypothetical protein
MQLFSSLSFQFPTVLTWFFSVLCMLDVGGMPLCNLHVSVRLWRDLVVRPTHVVQITSTTPRPVLPPTQNPDGPRAEALTKPETLRAWLKRIEYEVLVFFSYFYADTHIICSVKLRHYAFRAHIFFWFSTFSRFILIVTFFSALFRF